MTARSGIAFVPLVPRHPFAPPAGRMGGEDDGVLLSFPPGAWKR